MDRHHRAGRQHRTLHAFLAALIKECGKVLEIAESFFVDAGFGAHRQCLTDLGDHHPDLAGGICTMGWRVTS